MSLLGILRKATGRTPVLVASQEQLDEIARHNLLERDFKVKKEYWLKSDVSKDLINTLEVETAQFEEQARQLAVTHSDETNNTQKIIRLLIQADTTRKMITYVTSND